MANSEADRKAILIPLPVIGAILPAESPRKIDSSLKVFFILKFIPLMVAGCGVRNSACSIIFLRFEF
jgi:hypothetical protein